MDPYIKPWSDIFVKYLFGAPGHEEILLSFINDVLTDSGSNKIDSVTIENPFNLQEFSSDKLSILDVRAVNKEGKVFHIEIQSQGSDAYKNRILYYWAKTYSSQMKKGDLYVKLKPVISIHILNFSLIKGIKDWHNWFYLCKNGNIDMILTDHLLIHILELPKLKSILGMNHLERWLYFLKNEGNKMNKKDKLQIIIKDDEILERAHKIYEHFCSDDQLRHLYESRMEAERLHMTYIEDAKMEGKAEGKAEGTAEGIKREKVEIAKKMIHKRMDKQIISSITGLSESEIQQLEDQ
mgnify:CR=1 FL=1